MNHTKYLGTEMSQLGSSKKLSYSEIVEIVQHEETEVDSAGSAVSDLYAQIVALLIGRGAKRDREPRASADTLDNDVE